MADLIQNNRTIKDYLDLIIQRSGLANEPLPFAVGLTQAEWTQLLMLYKLDFEGCAAALTLEPDKSAIGKYKELVVYWDGTEELLEYYEHLESLQYHVHELIDRIGRNDGVRETNMTVNARNPEAAHTPQPRRDGRITAGTVRIDPAQYFNAPTPPRRNQAQNPREIINQMNEYAPGMINTTGWPNNANAGGGGTVVRTVDANELFTHTTGTAG